MNKIYNKTQNLICKMKNMRILMISLKFRFLLFVLLIPIATGSFFIACNSENLFSGDIVNDVDTEMRKILGEHLTVENNRYVLKLSETNAMASGVSQSFYAKFLAEIAESNAFIEFTENDPNTSVILNSQSNQDINHKPIRLKNGDNESTAECWYSITSFALTAGTHSVNIPLGAKNIRLVVKTFSAYSINFLFNISELGMVANGNSILGTSWSLEHRIQTPCATWHINVSSLYATSNCTLYISYN
jgi:hypothetical protein